MIGRRMCHSRQAAFTPQAFVRFWPVRNRGVRWSPVSIGGFVTPFQKPRHDLGVCSGATKCLHSLFTIPYGQGPECAPSVDKKSSTAKPWCANELALRKKSLPHERQKVLHKPNAQTRDRGQHGSILSESRVLEEAGENCAELEVSGGDHCTFCSRATSFCAKFSSDSDQRRRAVARVFFSAFIVNSTSLPTLSRTFAWVSSVSAMFS